MKVLVAIDAGPSSQAIIDALVKMRWYVATEIVLLTVMSPESEGTEEGQKFHDEVENVAVELRNCLRDCEVSFFAKAGDPKTVILEFAEHNNAELIVVGSNCKSTLERLLLGSVSQSILNGAKCPVIVAKTPCSLAREESPGFKTILVTIDNSVFSDMAVSWLANFYWAAEAKFIVAVVPEDADIQQVNDSLAQRAANLSRLLNTTNVMVEIVAGEPQHTIIDLAQEHYADLILMGSHGHTGLKELILGSVTQSVSHDAPCAVAVVRGGDLDVESSGEYRKVKKVPASKSSGGDDRYKDRSTHGMPGGF